MNLYEILVPTIYGDTQKPISTKHHKEWDRRVRKITGGLTIYAVAKGQWVDDLNIWEERIIPVRILCKEGQIETIVQITLQHYRQKAVMHYLVSDNCHITYAEAPMTKCKKHGSPGCNTITPCEPCQNITKHEFEGKVDGGDCVVCKQSIDMPGHNVR